MTNGFTGIFMVASVTAAPAVGGVKKDRQQKLSSDSGRKNAESLFANILEETIQEQKEDVVDCRSTTYGRDSRMQTFLYQTREYHY